MNKETKIQKLDTLIRHKKDVIENCILLSERLISIDSANIDFARKLIANSFSHDNSKLSITLEWNHLTNTEDADEMLEIAVRDHAENNLHHPEAHVGGIKEMPDIYLCECLCDWKSRSSELGTDLREWIDTKATKRWSFTKRDKVYKKIMKYVELLLEPGL